MNCNRAEGSKALPCRCENRHCDHGEKACPRDTGTHRVMYVGNVCDACFQAIPKEYRLVYCARCGIMHGICCVS